MVDVCGCVSVCVYVRQRVWVVCVWGALCVERGHVHARGVCVCECVFVCWCELIVCVCVCSRGCCASLLIVHLVVCCLCVCLSVVICLVVFVGLVLVGCCDLYICVQCVIELQLDYRSSFGYKLISIAMPSHFWYRALLQFAGLGRQ